MVLSLVGSFAIRQNFFDVMLTLGFGLIGFFMSKGGFPAAPVVLGLVLGHEDHGGSAVRPEAGVAGGDHAVLQPPGAHRRPRLLLQTGDTVVWRARLFL